MMAQLLVDAGYTIREDITEATNLTPKKLYNAIARQRGKHGYEYMSRPVRRKKMLDDPSQTSSLLEPGRQYTSVLHVVSIEPICKMCTKTLARCNLNGGRVPEFCVDCTTNKVQSISAAVTISKRQFRKFDTVRDGSEGARLGEAELRPLIDELGIKDWRGLDEEGIDADGGNTVDIAEFSAWFDERQKRKALEARARSCGIPTDQIGSESWRAATLVQKQDHDNALIKLIVEKSTCHHPQAQFDDGLERPVLCDQPCYVVLRADAKSSELSYVLPQKSPQAAFESLGAKDLNDKSLKNLFKAMGVVLPGRDGKFRTDAMKKMAGSENGAVSFDAFSRWWKATGAQQVLSAQSSATARIRMSTCKSVTTRPGGSDQLHIIVDTPDHIITFAVQRAEEALRAEGTDTDHVAWSSLLAVAVPEQHQEPNWGPDMQDRTDRAIKYHNLRKTSDRSSRLRNLSSSKRRDHCVRAAEQHIRNAYEFSTGATTAKRVMLRELFDQFDHDKSGALDVAEARRLLKQLRRPAETLGKKDVKVNLKKREVAAIIKEMEDSDGKDTARNGMIEYNEFSAWWDKRASERRERGLVEEYWSAMRGRASAEFAAAIEIFNDMESKLKYSLLELIEKSTISDADTAVSATPRDSVATEVAAREADYQLLFNQYATRGFLEYEGALELLKHVRLRSGEPKDRHAIYPEVKRDKMWYRMDRRRHGKKVESVDFQAFESWWQAREAYHAGVGDPGEYWAVETEKRANELEDQRVALDVMEIDGLRRSVKEIGAGEEAQHMIDEVVLAREKRDILIWCKKAEEALSKMTSDLIPKRKSVSLTKGLRLYEEALRLDETNPRLQDRVDALTKQFNAAAKQLEREKIRVFATQLLKYSGDWSEVTAEVNRQRLFKPHQKKIDAKYCAQLLIDIISRQSYVWVGSTWCPWLPLVAFALQILMFWSLSNAMSGIKFLNLAPKRALVSSGSEWSAAETKRTFMTLSLGALLACLVPQLIWLNQEPTCGPHSAHNYEDDDGNVVEGSHTAVFETFSVYMHWLEQRAEEDGESTFLSDEVSVIASFFFNPPVLLIIIFVLWTRVRFYKANYHIVAKELQKAHHDAEAEKKNFTAEHQELIRRTVDTQMKYGNAVRQHLLDSAKESGEQQIALGDAAASSTRSAAYNKTVEVLAQQMQHEHDNRQLSVVNEATDAMLKDMFSSCALLQGAPIQFESVAAAQPMLELAASLQGSSAEHTDELADTLIGLSSLLIVNISASFATERYILKTVRGWAGENVVLACTVHRISDKKGGAEASGNYVYPSLALVTFMSQSHLAKVHGKMRAAPPSDVSLQGIKGTWHGIPWPQAQQAFPHHEQLQGQLSVHEGAVASNSALIDEHNEKLRLAVKGGTALSNSEPLSKQACDHPLAPNDKQQAGTGTRTRNPLAEVDDDDDRSSRTINPMLAHNNDVTDAPTEAVGKKSDALRVTTEKKNRRGKRNNKRGKTAKKQPVAVANPMFQLQDGDDSD